MDIMIPVLTLLAGLLAGWALRRSSAASSSAAAVAERNALLSERAALLSDRDQLTERLRGAEAEAARLGAGLEHERRAASERAEQLERDEQRLREAFSALSREALARSSEEFIQLAESKLKQAGVVSDGDLAKRQQAIEGMVAPLRDTLTKVEQQMHSVERQREGAYRDLLAQVGTMQKTSAGLESETRQLVNALRAPQVRGRWGELQLEQIVRTAGMVEHCDFETQATASGEDGVQRPDLVVRLADDKRVVVDAKVSFIGFLEANEAPDDSTRTKRLAAHARHMRDHVDRLAAKSYWQLFDPAPEFVVMFVPAEVFLNAALDKDPALLEYAFERNVVIATPPTLMALLRTVAYTWRQEALAANAAKIHQLGKELHGRLATMGGHMAKLGGQLGRAVDAYNLTVSSMESRVLVTARKLTELQVSDSDLDGAEQLTQVPRQLQAPELVASASDALVALPESEQQDAKRAAPADTPRRRSRSATRTVSGDQMTLG